MFVEHMEYVSFWIKGKSIWINARYCDWIVMWINGAPQKYLHNILFIINNNVLLLLLK